MDDNTKVRKQLESRRDGLNKVFDRNSSMFRELQEYINPWSGVGLMSDSTSSDDLEDGGVKDTHILDPTATFALEVLAAGMQSGLTSPARPWFRLGLADDEVKERPNVKRWLYHVENGMRYMFSRSNLYQGLHHTYKELGNYATGAIGLFENYDRVIHCRPFSVGEYRIGLGPDLRVDTFIHYAWMSARQIVGKFGIDRVSRQVKEAYENNKSENTFKVVWLVEPNDDRLELKDILDRPFRSIYWENDVKEGENAFLEIGGFESFPTMTPRWDVLSSRTYGSGPGHKARGHVKMLQKMQEKSLIALDKEIDPPLAGPAALKSTMINTMPGGVTALDELSSQHGLRKMYDVRPDMASLEYKIQGVQQQIRQAFYNDLFMMLASMPTNKNMTATEVVERHEEKLIMLGPVLERLHAELLDPIIDRAFLIMLRNDLVPPPPEEIRNQEIKVEYISILAQAQKMVGVSAVNQFMGYVGSVAGVRPETLDKVDLDQSVDVFADLTGVPPSLVVPDDKVAVIRAKRAEAQQAKEMAESIPPMAKSAKDLSEANLEENSALRALLGGPQEAGARR